MLIDPQYDWEAFALRELDGQRIFVLTLASLDVDAVLADFDKLDYRGVRPRLETIETYDGWSLSELSW